MIITATNPLTMLIGIIDYYDDNKNIREEEEEVRNTAHTCIYVCQLHITNTFVGYSKEKSTVFISRKKRNRTKEEKELNAHNRFSTKTEKNIENKKLVQSKK